MKNPKLLFLTNVLIMIYLGVISFYMFNDFFMFEQRHHHGASMEPTNGNNVTSNSTSKSMVLESAQYQEKKDPSNILHLKLYLIVHNLILIFVFRLSISRQT